MERILVAWEDQYCDKLDLCLRRARRAQAEPGEGEPLLSYVSVRGHGGFDPYVRKDWPRARDKGLPKSGGPIAYLVCIADADRAHECSQVELPPEPPRSTGEWIQKANERFTDRLRTLAGDQQGQIFGRFLRWNKETMLIAGFDVPSVLATLGVRESRKVTAFLSSCQPTPTSVSDAEFVDHYRRAGTCLRDLLRAGGGPTVSKGDKRIDDALGVFSSESLAKMLLRVPDLVEVASLLRQLSAGPELRGPLLSGGRAA